MFVSKPIFEPQSLAPMCHCATLVELADGSLMAAWFAGSYETAPDQAIFAARMLPSDCCWSKPRVIADTPGHADGQPVLYTQPDGSLRLFFVTIANADWKSARLRSQTSPDSIHWNPPQYLNERAGLMFRSKAVDLGAGNILLPIYDENLWESMMMISQDGGRTWHLGHPIVTPPGNIHPTVVRLGDETVLAYLRTGGEGGWIWKTTSSDRGENWDRPVPTGLPNPNSGLDLLRLRNGHLVLAFNNSSRRRTPLCIAVSTDQGETWPLLQTLEDEDAEFSYPTLLQTRDGRIHCVYTWRREAIQHAVFDEDWIRGKGSC